jgi:pimeloyl-ACP methyl ester carboxylesterase
MRHTNIFSGNRARYLCILLLLCMIPRCGYTQQMTARHKGYLSSPYGFWEYLPRGYNARSQWPVVVYLHGIRESGSGTSTSDLRRVLLNGPPKLIVNGGRQFDFVLIAPQSPGMPEGFNTTNIRKLITFIKDNYNIDEDRIYFTGLSYGGFATWHIANELPQEIAAIIPICSCGGALDPRKLKSVPAWAFVNERDWKTVPACMRALINSIRKVGGTPLLTAYDRRGHDAWTNTYENEKVWDWLLSQRRAEKHTNQSPTLICPLVSVAPAGPALSLQIMASDRENDSLQFIFDSPLPHGFELQDLGNGQISISTKSAFAGSYTFSVKVMDKFNNAVSRSFSLEITYVEFLLRYLFLLSFYPVVLELTLVVKLILAGLVVVIAIYLLQYIRQLLDFFWRRKSWETFARSLMS